MSLSSESAIPSLQRQLSAAEGWLELGDVVSAHDELEEIAPRLRAHPQVLVMRCRIYGQARRWESVLIQLGDRKQVKLLRHWSCPHSSLSNAG